MAYHVRPLGGAEAVFNDYEVACGAARSRADSGTQAALFEVGEDGGEVLLVTFCRPLQVDLAAVQPEQRGQSPFTRAGAPAFVFIDPRNIRPRR